MSKFIHVLQYTVASHNHRHRYGNPLDAYKITTPMLLNTRYIETIRPFYQLLPPTEGRDLSQGVSQTRPDGSHMEGTSVVVSGLEYLLVETFETVDLLIRDNPDE